MKIRKFSFATVLLFVRRYEFVFLCIDVDIAPTVQQEQKKPIGSTGDSRESNRNILLAVGILI